MKNLKNFVIGLIALASFVNQSFAQETAVLKTKTKSNQSNDRTAGYDIKKNVKCRVIPTETGCTIVFDNVISTSSVAGISGGVVAGKRGYDYYKSMSCFSVSSADNSVSIVSPRDPASGLPTGKRMHKPFVITKELDKSSPTLTEPAAKNREASAPSVSEVVVTKSAVQESLSSGMGVGKATFKEFTVTKRCDGKTTKISCPDPDDDCDISLEDCPDGSCEILCSWSWGLSQQGSSMSSSGSAGFVAEIKDGICTAMAIKEKPKMTQHK